MTTPPLEIAPLRPTSRLERPPHPLVDLMSRPSPGLVSRESTVSLGVVRALIDQVARTGRSAAELLRAAQLRPEQLHSEQARLSRSVVYRLCEVALDVTGDAALGLHWGEGLSESTFIPISQLMAHAPTLRQGFAAMAQFERLLSDDPSYELLESDSQVVLRARSPVGASSRVERFIGEALVAGFFRLLRDFRGDALPQRVSFRHAAPPYDAEYTRVFGRAALFSQPFTGLVFDRALLDAPAPHQDEALHEAVRRVAERRLLAMTQRMSYAQRVREFLVQQGGPHRTDMDQAARALGLSVRSLRRRLSAEGQPYRILVNEAQMIVAAQLLVSKQSTIQETAYAMGFADARSFHRAFRRWSGMTPTAYRKSQANSRA